MGATPPAEYDGKISILLHTLREFLDPSTDVQALEKKLQKQAVAGRGGSCRRLLVIAVLSVLTGLVVGLISGGVTMHGFTTGFIATLIAWIVYALIARLMKK